MSHHYGGERTVFMAIALHNMTPGFVAQEIVAQLKHLFPKLEPATVLASHAESSTQDAATIILNIDNVPVSIMTVPSPVPEPTLQLAETISLPAWPQLSHQLRDHQAHTIVHVSGESTDLSFRLKCAIITHCVAAALAQSASTTAVYWVSGETLTEPQSFINAAKQAAEGQLPFNIWIGFEAIEEGRTTDDKEDLLSMLSYGVAAFFGHELDWVKAPVQATEAAEALIGFVQMMLAESGELEESDSFDLTNADGSAHHLTIWKTSRLLDGAPTVAVAHQKSTETPESWEARRPAEAQEARGLPRMAAITKWSGPH